MGCRPDPGLGRASSTFPHWLPAHPGYTNSTQGTTRNATSPHLEESLEPHLTSLGNPSGIPLGFLYLTWGGGVLHLTYTLWPGQL